MEPSDPPATLAYLTPSAITLILSAQDNPRCSCLHLGFLLPHFTFRPVPQPFNVPLVLDHDQPGYDE